MHHTESRRKRPYRELNLNELCKEVNKLRKRDGEEDHDLGPLAVVYKVFSHFHHENNPRVAEALRNVEERKAAKSA